MSVIFEAVIKVDEKLDWYIVLKDTVVGRSHNCLDMDEFLQKIEDFGADYGGHIDEVKWSKDDNVSPQAMDEIRLLMAKHQQEIEDAKEQKS
ncbi:hypothetical protein M947_04885 [Sulfurimonas hongkongensis]|uniref:Uncharacterized protein n=1 Tax=Sulfurimonas hongkongensis TaxID=1172190 RepID=T0JFS6_9BACT|nr:hypothetical protein [Sulfurimonas hongkongensis]EQB39920.1 hypothetical protein M947_04885 [Sulfurimonas hongkongensis]